MTWDETQRAGIRNAQKTFDYVNRIPFNSPIRFNAWSEYEATVDLLSGVLDVDLANAYAIVEAGECM